MAATWEALSLYPSSNNVQILTATLVVAEYKTSHNVDGVYELRTSPPLLCFVQDLARGHRGLGSLSQ